MASTEDPYEFLSRYYVVSEQKIGECIDHLHDIFKGDPDQIARLAMKVTLDEQTMYDSRFPTDSIFVLLRNRFLEAFVKYELDEMGVECNEGELIINEPFQFDYVVEDSGEANVSVSFPFGNGERFTIKAYRGIWDEDDPLQEQIRVFVELSDPEMEFTNDETVDWDQSVSRQESDEIKKIRYAVYLKSTELIVAELINFGRYAMKWCRGEEL